MVARWPLRGIDVPAGTPDGQIPTVSGNRLVYTDPAAGGGVQSVVAGTGIAVDDTDPANPVVSATGSGSGGTSASPYTFDASSVEAGFQHTGSAAGYSSQNWVVSFNTAVKVSGIKYDVASSETFSVYVDSKLVMTEAVTGPALDHLFSFPEELTLPPGDHRFEVRTPTTLAKYYSQGGTSQSVPGDTGGYITRWETQTIGNLVAARIVFRGSAFVA